MNFSYKERHNVAAYLETTHKKSEPFRHAINYLRRSRVGYALSANTPIYEDHQREFWDSVVFSEDKQTLTGTIANQSVTVSEAIIREVLHLGDSGTTTSLSPNFVRETILLMGYPEDRYTNEGFKKYLCPQWRFILHTYLHCMTHLQAAWDRLQTSTAHPFVAIVRNRPFNFSNWIFQRLLDNLSPTKNKKSSLLFPRYLQLIFNHQRPDLPRPKNVLLRGDLQYRVFVAMEGDPRVPDVPLLPHMIGDNLQVDPDAATMDEDEEVEDEEYQPEFSKEELVTAAQEYWSRRPANGPLPDYFSSDEDDGGGEFQAYPVDNSQEIPLLNENTEPEAINLDRDDILPCPRGQRYTLRPRQDPTVSEEEERDDAENAKEVEDDKDDDNDNDGGLADIRRQHIVPTRTRPRKKRVCDQPEDTDEHVVLHPQVRDGDEALVTQEDAASSERSSKLLRLAEEVTRQHVLITSEPPPLTSAAPTAITNPSLPPRPRPPNLRFSRPCTTNQLLVRISSTQTVDSEIVTTQPLSPQAENLTHSFHLPTIPLQPPPTTSNSSTAQTSITTTTTIPPLHTIPRNPFTDPTQTTTPTTTQNPPITTTATTRRPPIIPSHLSTMQTTTPSHQGSPSLQPIYDCLNAQDAIIQA